MEGSLTAAKGPGGVAEGVVPGRNPCFQVLPLSVEVAQPISEAPPLKKRPDCTTMTIVEPYESVSGSTWVLCWLDLLVKGSLLSRRSVGLPPAAKARAVVVSVSSRATLTAMAARARQPEREIACMPDFSFSRLA